MTQLVAIYLLRDPHTGLVRYVGKAVNPKARFKRHLLQRKTTTRCSCWIRSLAIRGVVPVLEVARWVPETQWAEAERRVIEFFRTVSPVPLTNICDGGQCGGGMVGRLHSIETRSKISRANKGKSLSVRHVAIMRAQRLGVKHSSEHNAKIAASLLGKKRTPEQCAAFSAAQKARRAREVELKSVT